VQGANNRFTALKSSRAISRVGQSSVSETVSAAIIYPITRTGAFQVPTQLVSIMMFAAKIKKKILLASPSLSVRLSACYKSRAAEWIFMKFDTAAFFLLKSQNNL
jgi:hypothetical protein